MLGSDPKLYHSTHNHMANSMHLSGNVTTPTKKKKRINWQPSLRPVLEQWKTHNGAEDMVVSMEVNASGARQFAIVESSVVFSMLQEEDRFHSLYEVILEGVKIRAIFDCEQEKAVLPEGVELPDANVMARRIMGLIQIVLEKSQGFTNDEALRAISDPIVMISSNEDKMSFHLGLPHLVLDSIADNGALVRFMFGTALELEAPSLGRGETPETPYGGPIFFDIVKANGVKDIQCTIDMGIYTGNRNMRFYTSEKSHQTLRPTGRSGRPDRD